MMNDTLNAKLRYTFICVSLAQYLTNKFFFFLHFHACRLTGNLFHSEKMPGLYTVVNVVKAYIFIQCCVSCSSQSSGYALFEYSMW